MKDRDFSEAAVEINSIFDNMPHQILNKIPQNIIDNFKSKASPSYTFQYDKTKLLEEQSLKLETKIILAWLYKEYICNENEKIEYENKLNELKKCHEEVFEKIGTENLFKKNHNNENLENNQTSEITIINKKQNFFSNILKKIKSIFSK